MLLPFEKEKHRIFTANSKKILYLWEERAHVFKHPAVLVLLLQKWTGRMIIDIFYVQSSRALLWQRERQDQGGCEALYNNASEGTTIITKLWVHILASSLGNSNQFGPKSSFCSVSEWTRMLKWRVSVRSATMWGQERWVIEEVSLHLLSQKSGISGSKHHLGAGDVNSC